MKILKDANLEKFGFKKHVESTIETDENGEMRLKKTITYMATDHCSKAAYWERLLEERLPADFSASKLGTTFVREIQSRIKGRETKYCKIGLEVHLNRCRSDTTVASRREKRGAAPCGICIFCGRGEIFY